MKHSNLLTLRELMLENRTVIVNPMTKTLYVSYGLPSHHTWKNGGFPICTAQQTPLTRVRCAFLQRSSSSVYPGFFKTPQIAVGPHDNQ